MSYKIERYTDSNKKEVLILLKLNIPKYFATSEKADYISYLENDIEDYFVVKTNEKIIGAAGVNYENDSNMAILSWDIIHPNFHGKGIGKLITNHRIRFIKNQNKFKSIVVRTSQHTYKFYEKKGFKLQDMVKDHWAKDFHLYYMELLIA